MDESPPLPTSSRLYLSARAVGLVAGLLGAIVAARLLGPDGRGSLGLFVFAVALGVATFGIGLPTAVYDRIAHHPVDARKALRAAGLVAGLAGLASAGILLALGTADWADAAFGGVPASLVALAGGLGIGGTLLVQAHTMAAIARGATYLAAAGQAVPVVFAAGSYIVSLFVLRSGLGGAILGYGLAAMLAAALIAAAAHRLRGGDGPERSTAGTTAGGTARTARSLLSRGKRVAVADIAYVLSYRVDVLLVAALAGLASLGRYNVGVQLVEPMAVAGTALGMSMLGAAAGSTPSGSLQRAVDPALQRSVGTAARISVLVCLAGGVVSTLGTLVFGEAVLGPGYASIPVVMAILVPGVAAIAATRVLSGAVVGHGGLGIGSVIASATVVVNIVLNLVLVPAYAEFGAAVASSVAYSLSLTLWLRAWRARGGELGLIDVVPRPSDGLVLLAAIRGRAAWNRPSS